MREDAVSREGLRGPFRLGVEAPLSGEQAVLGKGMLNGAKLAAKQLNGEGGILGPGTWSPYTFDSVNFLADGSRKRTGPTPAS